jgi:hypothetical protein
MYNLKTFVCCKCLYSCKEDFSVTGNEQWVVEEAVKHLFYGHGMIDNEEIRKKINKSLIEENNSFNYSKVF